MQPTSPQTDFQLVKGMPFLHLPTVLSFQHQVGYFKPVQMQQERGYGRSHEQKNAVVFMIFKDNAQLIENIHSINRNGKETGPKELIAIWDKI